MKDTSIYGYNKGFELVGLLLFNERRDFGFNLRIQFCFSQSNSILVWYLSTKWFLKDGSLEDNDFISSQFYVTYHKEHYFILELEFSFLSYLFPFWEHYNYG